MTGERTVLVLSPGPDLVSPASGAGTRLKELSRGLATAHDWTVVAMVPADSLSERPDWVDHCYTFDQWSLPFLTDANPSFVRTLARVLRAHDVDVVHAPSGVCTAKAFATLFGNGTDVSYAAQNVEAEHAADFVDPSLPVYKRVLGPTLIPIIERAWVACADLVTTVSDADRAAFVERYGVDDDRITTIPTGTVDRETLELASAASVRDEYDLTAEHVAVFHGSYAHPPNQEAVEAIRDEVAPALDERGVDVEFLVVGDGVPDIDDPRITVTGFVDDLFSVLNAADVAVVPIRHGGGTKTKVYDYITLGLPMVTTAKGVEGIDVDDDKHALIVDDVDEAFVDGTVELLSSSSRRARMRRELLELADRWSWGRSTRRLDEFYRGRQ